MNELFSSDSDNNNYKHVQAYIRDNVGSVPHHHIKQKSQYSEYHNIASYNLFAFNLLTKNANICEALQSEVLEKLIHEDYHDFAWGPLPQGLG